MLPDGLAVASPVSAGAGAGSPAASPAGDEYYALTWLDVRYDTDVLLARSVARQVGGELGLDSGDQTRIATAVSEIARNALMYAHGGRVEFVVEEEHGAQWLAIYVRDDGPGIAAQDLPHVFERFYLHDRLKSDHDIGTGLGLAIVKELVERMGGEVSVASEPGKGAVFSLKLRPFRAANDPT